MGLKDRVFGLWAVLDKMPSTNAKIASGIILGYLTGVVYLIAVITQRDSGINAEAFAFWLTFVLVLDGLATWQYAKKRDTYAAPSPDSERAAVPSTPAPSTPDTPVPPSL
jgi:hypothetical protein